MKSTIEREFVYYKKDKKFILVPKEYPDWYGIEDIGFIWINTQTDPQIEYKGRRCSCFLIEESMWEQFREDYPDISESEQEDKFEEYMKVNEHEVKELCELALFGGNW